MALAALASTTVKAQFVKCANQFHFSQCQMDMLGYRARDGVCVETFAVSVVLNNHTGKPPRELRTSAILRVVAPK